MQRLDYPDGLLAIDRMNNLLNGETTKRSQRKDRSNSFNVFHNKDSIQVIE